MSRCNANDVIRKWRTMASSIENGATAPPGYATGVQAQHERDGGRVGEHNKYRTNGTGAHPVRCAP